MKQSTHYQNIPRILHLVPGFRSGGIESLLMSLYRCLDKDMFQFDFMVDTCDTLPEFDEIIAAGGRVFQMGRYLDSPVKYQLKLNRILKKHGHEYIALHSHTVIRALPVLWAARQYNIPQRILHSHTDSLKGSELSLIAPFIVAPTAFLATDYWACSEAAGRFFFKRQAYKIFPNTIETQRFKFNPNERSRIRELLDIKKNSLVIGHTGRFTYPKNHMSIIKVFAELHSLQPDARLILVGEGPLESEMKNLAARLGVSEAIFFVGLQADVASYLSAMDVFFLPSHYEGFCISLLEAQANGLPCLTSSVIPNEVQITPSVTICEIDTSASEYVNALLKLHEIGRMDSASNIALIQQSGYDTDLQLDSLLAMYNKD